ncbi:hypothetical protein Pla123a_21610 [Posidoniimonas polymericola]|uniref:VWFA domain-containing protein n=1 Tax=Posidoniimonas polymericola TaxID=2528002 RepID=A0A5C5YRZ3_9BACT|nr:VWA domain-containing protein [Posidoniimonas polymericola]TWT77500.1 hypothetical protein Pla123a_21610 [Posidoniimonas polymericola]
MTNHLLTLLAQAAAPETDAVWRLRTHWTFAPWLTVVLITASVALVAYCYARERTPAGAAYRALLGLLRVATIAMILVMLSELLLAGTRSGRPRFGWIFDTSGSMTVTDAARGADAPTRIDKVKAKLLENDASLLTQVDDQYDAYARSVDDVSKAVGDADTPLPDAVAALSADPDSMSRLGDAIDSLVDRSTGPAPQAVVVWTDGRSTAGRSLSAAADAARRAGTRLYFVGVGAEQSPPDIVLSDPLADEVVFVDDILSFGATLRVKGALNEPVRLTLRQEGDSRVLADQTLTPVGDSSEPIQLLHRPTEPGDYRYVIEALPVEGERDPDNNRVTFDVQVRKASVRVLLAAGYPLYEFRYLKSLLGRDSTIQLKTYLQESDLDYATSDQTAVQRFPMRRGDLDQFDVVVLMDLDPRLLPRSTWSELSDFVSKDGGGVILVAGSRYLPWSYKRFEDFRALSPTDLDSAPIASRSPPEQFLLRPTPLGMQGASFQLGDSRAESESIWRKLTPLNWAADLGEPKPAAQVLATHPNRTTPDGRPLPLVVSQYFGSGQVLAHAFDSSYLWRKRVGDVYFARYWVQTLRRLAHGRLKRDDRGWELMVERGEYERGEPVRVRLRTPDGGVRSAAVLLQPEGGPEQRVELAPSAVRPGVLEADLNDLAAGSYRVLLAGADSQAVSATFSVVNPPGEFAQLEMNSAGMRAAAERTGGAFYKLDEADQLLANLPEAQRVPIESLPPIELWNRWWMLAGICGCLCAEWILRKRKAML